MYTEVHKQLALRITFHASFSSPEVVTCLTDMFNLEAKTSASPFWQGGYDFKLSEIQALAELFNCSIQQVLAAEF